MQLIDKLRSQSLFLQEILFPRGYDTADLNFFEKIKLLSYFKWFYHTGSYVDFDIEQVLSEYNHSINTDNPYIELSGNRKRRVLHVATQLYNTGGHTRLIRSFIDRDNSSTHDLLLTEHSVEAIPDWISEAVRESGGKATSIVAESYPQRVLDLRKVAQSGYDVIFLHTHPDDPIPVASLSSNDLPPVVLINHADHVFWLGVSVADIVVCFRNWSLQFSTKRRGIKQGYLLPIPLSFEGKNKISKTEAKSALNIDDDKVLIITVASYYKFIPDEVHDYFDLIYKCLEENKNAIVKVIGISNDDDLHTVGYIPHERLFLVGVVENPYLYYNAADMYVESMPVNSLTSIYEACYYEACPVLYHNPVTKLNINDDYAFSGLVQHSNSVEEQLDNMKLLINNKSMREQIASECSRRISYYYAGEGWSELLNKLYEKCKSIDKNISIVRMSEKRVIDQDDIDSAFLTQSAFSKNPQYLLHIISNNIKLFSAKSIIKLFYMNLKFREKETLFSYTRGYAYLLKIALGKK